nr:MAG TPA: hypothetical protein [Caudoviricetes sp.]
MKNARNLRRTATALGMTALSRLLLQICTAS